MTSQILVAGGYVVLVDDEDIKKVEGYTWHVERHGRGASERLYVRCTLGKRPDGKRGHVYLHRLIADAQPDKNVDHINHNGLDNRRDNLRVCSHKQNHYNLRKRSGETASAYKGVSRTRGGRWRAYIAPGGKQKHLGIYDSEEDAARAYDRAARDLYGEYALLNFPSAN